MAGNRADRSPRAELGQLIRAEGVQNNQKRRQHLVVE